MSVEVTGVYPEKTEAFSWTYDELINQPPYSHYDMVRMLADGRFLINGHESNIEDAYVYADYHDREPDVTRAIEDHNRGVLLALGDIVY